MVEGYRFGTSVFSLTDKEALLDYTANYDPEILHY